MMTDFKEQEWLASHFRQRLSDLGNHIVRVKRVISEMLVVFREDDLSTEFIEPDSARSEYRRGARGFG